MRSTVSYSQHSVDVNLSGGVFRSLGATIQADSVPLLFVWSFSRAASLAADREGLTIVQTAGKIKLILQCASWPTMERSLVCQARDKGRNREVNPLLCALYAAHLRLFTYDRARSAEATSHSSLLCSPRPRKRGTLHDVWPLRGKIGKHPVNSPQKHRSLGSQSNEIRDERRELMHQRALCHDERLRCVLRESGKIEAGGGIRGSPIRPCLDLRS